ncbi:MAG: hypothetical protein WA110_07760 [Anaerolineaceae bacterium]
MLQNWETVLTEFTYKCSALAALLFDGEQIHSYPGPFSVAQVLNLAKFAKTQPAMDPAHIEHFNALRLGDRSLLVFTCLLKPGRKALLAFPMEIRLADAQEQTRRFIEIINSVDIPTPELHLTDLKARSACEEHMELTWQDDFLSQSGVPETTDQPEPPAIPMPDEHTTRPVQVTAETPQKISVTPAQPNPLAAQKPYWFQVF